MGNDGQSSSQVQGPVELIHGSPEGYTRPSGEHPIQEEGEFRG